MSQLTLNLNIIRKFQKICTFKKLFRAVRMNFYQNKVIGLKSKEKIVFNS